MDGSRLKAGMTIEVAAPLVTSLTTSPLSEPHSGEFRGLAQRVAEGSHKLGSCLPLDPRAFAAPQAVTAARAWYITLV